MKRFRKVSVARDLTLWLVVGCLTLSAPVAFVGYRMIVNQAEAELTREATQLCAKFANVLHQHIWNLDDAAIAAYFDAYRVPDDLVTIRISTQYGDPIYTYTASAEKRVETFRRTLSHNDEEIGAVEVGLSRLEIESYRRQVAIFALVLAVLITFTIGLISAILIPLLLGRPLHNLIRQLRSVAGGNYSFHIPPHRYREVDEINTEVNLMTERVAKSTANLRSEIDDRRKAENALQNLRDNLEVLVDRRTTQLREVNQKLLLESTRRKRIQWEILEISNLEQRRIGQDLHDSLGQELAGIAYLTGSLEHNLTSKGSPEAKVANQIATLLRESVSHTQRVAKGLNPVALEDEGLVNALRGIAEDSDTLFRVDCRFTCIGDGYIYNNDVATHLFRITQEAIHNAIRHGSSTKIEIKLCTGDEKGTLIICDNGSGFSTQFQHKSGMGLRTMMYRTEMIGGKLNVCSTINSGTTITATFENTASSLTVEQTEL